MNEKQTQTKSPSENHGEKTPHDEAEKAAQKETPEKVKKESIKTLNDLLRTTYLGGRVVMVSGIVDLDEDHLKEIHTHVRTHSDFPEGNDRYQEHDFGTFECRGETVNWKIDYYDKSNQFLSPDPSDPSVTNRLLTIYLADDR